MNQTVTSCSRAALLYVPIPLESSLGMQKEMGDLKLGLSRREALILRQGIQ
jgi:hypothetical protein